MLPDGCPMNSALRRAFAETMSVLSRELREAFVLEPGPSASVSRNVPTRSGSDNLRHDHIGER